MEAKGEKAGGSAGCGDWLLRGKLPACIGMCQFCREKLPSDGPDAPTTARVMGSPPRRGIVLSFDAKESTKESQRHGGYGKKASTAHFAGGVRYVARNGVGQLSPTFGARSELAFFRRQNGRAFFPPLPIAALLPRRWRWADSKKCKLGCFDGAWIFSQHKKAGVGFISTLAFLCEP